MTGSVGATLAPMPGRDDARVVWLTLDRPARANSLTAELLEALMARLDAVAADPPAAVVLTGAGRHFSTGGDVARFSAEVEAGNGRAYAARTVGALNGAILRLVALPCPVIVAARGAVTGGALGLLLAADMVAMDRDCFLQPWYAVVGFAPDGGWTAMLPDRVGTALALEMQLRNRRVGAEEAARLGLASAVADAAGPEALVAGWLAELGAHRAGTLAATRALVWNPTRREALARALEAERTAFVDRIGLDDTRAGMAAFLAMLERKG